MKIGNNLKQLREKNKLTQQEMADIICTHRTGYSKMENSQQEITVDGLVMIAKRFGMTVDDIIFFDEKNNIPKEVSMEEKNAQEQIKLIQQLDEEDKFIVLKMIDKMLANKKFKDFFNNNVAAL